MASRHKHIEALFPNADNLPTRAMNALFNDLGGPTSTINPEDVAAISESEMLRIPNLGRKSVDDIVIWLATFGLSLRKEVRVKKTATADAIAASASRRIEREKRRCPCCGQLTKRSQ